MVQNQRNDTETSSEGVELKTEFRPFKAFFFLSDSLLRTEQLCCFSRLGDITKSRATCHQRI